MRDAPDQDEEQLVIEPITWLDGSPVRRRRRLGTPAWSGQLGRLGLLALGEGLALLGCFSLPWFSMSGALLGGDSRPDTITLTPAFLNFDGWSIARGMPLRSGPDGPVQVALFVHLWMVPLAAAALLVLAWAHARFQFSARLASGVILALSALTLLVGLGYYVQVTSLASIMTDPPASPTPIYVAWGWWLAVGVSVVAMLAAASALRPLPPSEVRELADG